MPEERQRERDKIRDRGIAMMDAIKAKHGEDHPMFWSAMAVCTDNLRAFDQGRPLQEFTQGAGDRRQSNYPKSHFDDCPKHEWKAVDSQSDNEWRHGVVCTKCGCPGDADNETGAVVWPAT